MDVTRPAAPGTVGTAPGTVGTAPGIVGTGLTRRFGTVLALEHADLTVQSGQVTALIGPNGAGKTTLLLILAGLLAPDAGSVSIAGLDPNRDSAAKAKIGWMPDALGHWEALTVREILAFFARAYRVPHAVAAERIPALLDRLHLADLAKRPARTLSRGQQQRLGLARALVHDPPVLLLDEPASGLDPVSRIELRDLLREQATEGKTVLVSSHVLSELDEIAAEAVFVTNGRTMSTEQVAQLAEGPQRYQVTASDPAVLAEALRAHGAVPLPGPGPESIVELDSERAAADLLAALVRDGIPVTAFAPAGGTLEGMYLRMSAGETEQR